MLENSKWIKSEQSMENISPIFKKEFSISGKVKKAFPSVPSYSCLEQRVENASGVFKMVSAYLTAYPADTDRVMKTLSYFDINNMVSLLSVPVDFFLGMIDPTCIPPFV